MLGNILRCSLSSVSSVCLFLLMIVAGRRLGAEEFGIFSFVLAFVSLFEPLINAGLSQLLIREIARDRDATKALLTQGIVGKLVVTPFVFFLMLLTIHFLQRSGLVLQAVCLMAVAVLVKALKDTFRSVLLGHELFGLDAFSLVIERFALLVFGTLVLINGYGILGLCWTFVLIRLADIAVIVAMVKLKVCDISCHLEGTALRSLLLAGFPIVGYAITVNVYSYIDTIMLSVLRSNEEVGWYNASYRIYEGLIIIPSIISTVCFPRLSKFYKEDKRQLNGLLLNGLKCIAAISIVVSALGVALSEKVIDLSFGDGYIQSVLSLKVLVGGVIFAFMFDFLQTALIAMDRQKLVLCAALIGLGLNVALNLWLIPRFGYVGAAAATVAAGAVVTSLLVFWIFRITRETLDTAYSRTCLAGSEERA